MSVYLPDGNNPLEDYMIFADVDLIVTDLDGTLIDGDAPVLSQIKKSIAKLKKKHTQITVATGRTYCGAAIRMQELGIDVGMPVALYNGGVVVEYGTGNILYASYVPSGVAKELLNVVDLQKSNILVYTFSACSPFTANNENSLIKENVYVWGRYRNEQDVNGMPAQRMSLEEKIDMKISAILVSNTDMSQEEKQKIFNVLHKYTNIKVTTSGNGYIEIKGEGMNKGIIYDILKKHEKFMAKKILAIGDNDNDIELFSGADISVAVANSSPLAFDYADYVCDNNSAQGFYEMLSVLEMAKRYYKGDTHDRRII